MTTTIQITETIQVKAEPLTQASFERFGDVVSNPRPDVIPSAYEFHTNTLPSNAFSANQGSAIQYRNVSKVQNVLDQSPSKRSEPKMSVFVCAARTLQRSTSGEEHFTVNIMERHPFTSQTFTPIASSASHYLVIVAPSLPPSAADEGLPVPTGPDLPGRGLPDVRGLRAFIATSRQAVTYGAGTWHSPMVALGQEGTTLDFVVTQFMSGEAVEDCQLVEFEGRALPVVRLQTPRRKLEKL